MSSTDSTIFRVLDALKSKIGADFTSDSSGVDMTGRVTIGSIIEPAVVPSASVAFIDYTTEHGRDLGSFRMTARFEAYIFTGGTTVEDRLKNTLNLTSDVIKNITADRFLGLRTESNRVIIDDVLCNFTTVEGERYGLDGIGIGYIEVVTPFQSRTGV